MSVPRVFPLAVIVAAVTFWITPASTAAQGSFAQAAKPAPAELPVNQHVPFMASVQAELNQRHFEALDKTAEELLRTKARFPGGDWKLFLFYDALGRPSGEDETDSDQAWEKHIALLRLWKVERKKSASAAIALAEAWTNYAWKARGSDFAKTVTDDMRRVFQQRLTVAENMLKDGSEFSRNNPHWYLSFVVLAQGQGRDLSEVEAVFQDAIEIEPLYPHLYSAVAAYLMPRWHGEEGDWERFADVATRRVGGREGAAIYGHIVMRISRMYRSEAFFAENKISWPRVRQALADREALYGTNRYILNKSCWLAGAADDLPTIRVLLARIGEAWDPEVWKERKRFDQYRAWALND